MSSGDPCGQNRVRDTRVLCLLDVELSVNIVRGNGCLQRLETRSAGGDPTVDRWTYVDILYILESNSHPNPIRTSFCRFLKGKNS